LSKKVIVLSDGTGNSAAKVWRTNVWRIFEALDLSRSDQVVMYDDGVGTSSFKPLAVLGGAFGYGLKRNVLGLYKFLCRNYKTKQDYLDDGISCGDDEIFAFGFSRGAFTIRVLIGLVLDQGLVNFETEEELDRKTKAAYRQYRAKNFKTYTGIEAPFRWLRSWFVSAEHDETQRTVTSVRFLGLWDTVAAYGFPIDEMMRGVSRYLWPLELPNRQLDVTKVRRACHALSIDDERTTFHPVLWDESEIPRAKGSSCGIRRTRSEQLSQVWFAGVHANVGGGYPDDSLAHVSLAWIMQEASLCGLRFKRPPVADPDSVLNLSSSQDKDGRLYDSRSGIGGYYRYGPRKIVDLCHSRLSMDLRDCVLIEKPKIHHSVFERLTVAAHFYAPVGLPPKYEVVARNGLIVQPGRTFGETGPRARLRTKLEELTVWNLVWRRRVVYFMSVAATLHLLAYPVMHQFSSAGELTTKLRFISDTVRMIAAVLPSNGWRWADAYAKDPLKFLIAAATVAVTILVGSRLGGEIRDQARTIWNLSTRRTGVASAIKLIREQRSARISGAKNYLFFLLLFAVALSPYLFEDNAPFPKLVSGFWDALKKYSLFGEIAGYVGSASNKLLDVLTSTTVSGIIYGQISFVVRDTLRVVQTVLGQISQESAPGMAALLLLALLLPDRLVYLLRTSHAYRKSLSFLRLKLAPAVLAIGLVYLGSALVGRYLFVLKDGTGAYCKESAELKQPKCTAPALAACVKAIASQPEAVEPFGCKPSCTSETVLIDTRSLCAPTGLKLSKGQSYVFHVRKATEQNLKEAQDTDVATRLERLKKNSGQEASPETILLQTIRVQDDYDRRGIVRSNVNWRFCYDFFNMFCYKSGVQKVLDPSVLQNVLAVVTAPLKRTLDRPLGNLIVRYGATGNEEAFADPDATAPDPNANDVPIHPTVSGELFVYLNKPVSGFWANMFNQSNGGIAKVTVSARPN
jgi:uncharacterized protein (DUF2235 family)